MFLVRRPYIRLTLAVLWMMLAGSFTLGSFMAGFLAATLVFAMLPSPVVRLARIQIGGVGGLPRWLRAVAALTLYFAWELVKSNYQVALLAIRPRPDLKPGIIAMKLDSVSHGRVALLSALINLTPGTLVLDVAEGEQLMYIHAIDARDEAETLSTPKRFEAMVAEVLL